MDVLSSKYPLDLEPIDSSKEAEYWVPDAAMSLAKDFHTTHIPHVPIDTIQAFLRNMNKVHAPPLRSTVVRDWRCCCRCD